MDLTVGWKRIHERYRLYMTTVGLCISCGIDWVRNSRNAKQVGRSVFFWGGTGASWYALSGKIIVDCSYMANSVVMLVLKFLGITSLLWSGSCPCRNCWKWVTFLGKVCIWNKKSHKHLSSPAPFSVWIARANSEGRLFCPWIGILFVLLCFMFSAWGLVAYQSGGMRCAGHCIVGASHSGTGRIKGHALKRDCLVLLISGAGWGERRLMPPSAQGLVKEGSHWAKIYIHSSFLFKLKLLSKEMHPGNRLSRILGKKQISLQLSWQWHA